MTLPGVSTIISDRRPSEFAPPSTSNWFVGGYAERGRTDQPILITSMAQKAIKLGDRTAETTVLHDALDAFFREGGRNAYVARIVGPSAVTATVTDTGKIKIDATSPGAWANDLDVVVNETSGSYTLTVTLDAVTVEASPTFANNDEAVAWAANSEYIRITKLGAGIPADGTLALAAGADDLNNVTITQVQAALAKFTESFGPGQVSLPGFTTASYQQAVLAHCLTFRRVGLLDALDSSNVSTVSAAATALRTIVGAQFCGLFWPWVTVPGVVLGTTRTVPPSAIQAGMIARGEASGRTPGDPVAGANGESRYAIGLSQSPVTDANREILNDSGVNVLVTYRSKIRTYGNRTVANPITASNWSQLSQSRIVMAVAAIAAEVSETYYQRKIDGRGFTVADYGQELAGRACLPLYNSGDLYGETPGEAFTVDVGPDVNNPADLAAGKLRAVIGLRTSPGADMVTLEIVKVPTGESL